MSSEITHKRTDVEVQHLTSGPNQERNHTVYYFTETDVPYSREHDTTKPVSTAFEDRFRRDLTKEVDLSPSEIEAIVSIAARSLKSHQTTKQNVPHPRGCWI